MSLQKKGQTREGVSECIENLIVNTIHNDASNDNTMNTIMYCLHIPHTRQDFEGVGFITVRRMEEFEFNAQKATRPINPTHQSFTCKESFQCTAIMWDATGVPLQRDVSAKGRVEAGR
jgi:hypothetical protein